ncbi:MAG: putative DNA modification/repair radical SAM protein [Fibrobacteres bacterium CG2_30_45_31]|nr:MAG: putative DNA modification/repair radical SAM protein [Fibrobacteres bacterium CG2_30_45_31]
MQKTIAEKLTILSAAAKYDVSCSSSGSRRATPQGGMGNGASMGICHSFTEDGRCISLLKILFSNACRYDCAYCVNRRSNDVPRATFEVDEVVELTLGFYERNYIEGLFLSSGVIRDPDSTMELLVRVAWKLRHVHRFGGYIHLKAIPGASPEWLQRAGEVADRLSVNIEVPSETSLKLLAPDKNYASVYTPMNYIAERKLEYGAGKPSRYTPKFVPAGQTTQMIVGASGESDLQILRLASGFYSGQHLKRVYYSGYIPVNEDKRLPVVTTKPPLLREHRLYQADWLMRFYEFRYDEIVDESSPHLDERFDPKLGWALRHPEFFPVDLNTADYSLILRIPGIGVRSARLIVSGRRFSRVGLDELKKMGVALKRAKYFIYHRELPIGLRTLYPEMLTMRLLAETKTPLQQLSLFDTNLERPAVPALS